MVGSGNDQIQAGNGNNLLICGLGQESLEAGNGLDWFGWATYASDYLNNKTGDLLN
jgi:Ca2+-binding RTX toxin-like protein